VGASSDSVARVFNGARGPAETIGPSSDSVARAATYARSVSETVGPSADQVSDAKNPNAGKTTGSDFVYLDGMTPYQHNWSD